MWRAWEPDVMGAVSKGNKFTALGRAMDRPGLGVLLTLVVLAWGVEVLDVLIFKDLDRFGIRPRQVNGLPGVVLSPWLHVGWGHLIANTLTFLGLGLVVLYAEGRRFIGTTLMLVILSGLGTWLIGRGNSVHVGASGLIYGYFGYLLGRAFWERRLGWAIVGILVGVIYGGMIWGVVPTEGRVSWEGHLAGFVTGVWLGRQHALARKKASGPAGLSV